jgi:hypothetical protein
VAIEGRAAHLLMAATAGGELGARRPGEAAADLQAGATAMLLQCSASSFTAAAWDDDGGGFCRPSAVTTMKWQR